METTGAMMLSLPRPMVAKAIVVESRTPRRGLLPSPCPLAKGSKKEKMRSADKDCKMRGAPKNDAMAEERVAAITPAVIRKSTDATRRMAA